MEATYLRFFPGACDTLAVIEVEGPVRAATHTRLHGALRELGILVSHGEAWITNNRLKERLFIRELHGAPVTASRHREIQGTLLEVVAGA